MRLAVTRQKDQLTDLAGRAARRDIEVVPLPLIETSPCDFEWPENLHMTDLDWLVFTSANGVEAFFSGLTRQNRSIKFCTRIAAVGDKTAEAILWHKQKVDFTPDAPYGRSLFEELAGSMLDEEASLMYARGARVNYDPAVLMAKHRIRYFPVVCYETILRPVEKTVVDGLSREDYILFTAPSTIHSYQEQFGRPVAKPIAIGRSTASAMNQYGWAGFITMAQPNVDNVLEYL